MAKLPDAPGWVSEIKLDGYRAIAVKDGTVGFFSRNKKSLGKKFPYIVEALAGLPEGTVVDGELVALGHERRQNSPNTARQSRSLRNDRRTESQGIGTCLADVRMVPGARIELATPAFSGRRSTSELPRHG